MANPALNPADLAPLMSEAVFRLHHDGHYAAYLEGVQQAIQGTPLETRSLQDIIEYARTHSRRKLYRNAAQAWNHGLFFASIAPIPDQAPFGELGEALQHQYGSLDAFAALFEALSKKHFASGWLWASADRTGDITISSTQDADPVWAEDEVVPLLVCDLWEHAYYIDWQRDRAGFVREFIRRWAHWAFAEQQYSAALKGDFGWRHPALPSAPEEKS
ncbi:MAG: hypothetical protein HC869_15280 [Rhodospirillales bacterium]|nr:hypothetical protein [Rhodospirillales bacterium]